MSINFKHKIESRNNIISKSNTDNESKDRSKDKSSSQQRTPFEIIKKKPADNFMQNRETSSNKNRLVGKSSAHKSISASKADGCTNNLREKGRKSEISQNSEVLTSIELIRRKNRKYTNSKEINSKMEEDKQSTEIRSRLKPFTEESKIQLKFYSNFIAYQTQITLNKSFDLEDAKGPANINKYVESSRKMPTLVNNYLSPAKTSNKGKCNYLFHKAKQI